MWTEATKRTTPPVARACVDVAAAVKTIAPLAELHAGCHGLRSSLARSRVKPPR